ncbi:mitofusin [Polyrhizophydium stewartii]|uniref:Mitofusin n=1 Tax=Polyrhizophydium stewartii TaxID=2732419 RepID=A0ABR4MY89_9FUNG|nr:mitofusin [Polyrhizophydium stewartii]
MLKSQDHHAPGTAHDAGAVPLAASASHASHASHGSTAASSSSFVASAAAAAAGSVFGGIGSMLDSAYASTHEHAAQTTSLFARNRQTLLFLLGQTKTLLESLAQPAPSGLAAGAGASHAGRRLILYPPAGHGQPTVLALANAAGTPSTSARSSAAGMSASMSAASPSSLTAPTSSSLARLASSVIVSNRDEAAAAATGAQADPLGVADVALAAMLLRKINDSLSHLERLEVRIADTQSRVLVTGDLNAGKSTFVNTILRRQIAPDDQQPCTALFVEVMDPQLNGGREEFHAIMDPEAYNPANPATFTRFDLEHLRTVVEENEQGFAMLKVYCMDNRDSTSSLLHNGIADISFIDSPGLNIDSMKTMSLFAKQEEIDVIVFVVNAENHFTLSGREFLETATKEKAYVFIVVNRFDMIRRKDRCRRDILDQIRSISQRTYEDANSLVHFVSARQVLEADLGVSPVNPEAAKSFAHLEDSLRTFILEKRSRSKLSPAKVYLGHVLSDVILISNHNASMADTRITGLASELQESAPMLQRMVSLKEHVLNDIDTTIEKTGALIESHSRRELGDFIAEIEPFSDGVQWNGVLHVWHYAQNLRQVVFRLATIRIRRCQDYARDQSMACVNSIAELAERAMSVPPQLSTAAISSAFEQNQMASNSPEDVALQMADLFDVSDRFDMFKDYVPGLALVTGGLIGYRTVASGLLRRIQSSGFLRMSRLAFTGVGLIGAGLVLYVLSDMKSSVQRKVTRKMRDHFEQTGFVGKTTEVLARTSRRALQSTMWEFQTQFQRVLTENEERMNGQYKAKQEAEQARDFFQNTSKRASVLLAQLDEVELEA